MGTAGHSDGSTCSNGRHDILAVAAHASSDRSPSKRLSHGPSRPKVRVIITTEPRNRTAGRLLKRHLVRNRIGVEAAAKTLTQASRRVITAEDVDDWQANGVPLDILGLVQDTLEIDPRSTREGLRRNETLIAFGRRLTDARNRRDLDQADMAKMLGKKGQSTYSAYETGANEIKLLDLVRCAEILKVSVGQLTGEQTAEEQLDDDLFLSCRALTTAQRNMVLKFIQHVLPEHENGAVRPMPVHEAG
jgi:transcriptional regulator with XRE-family HTH domain